MPYTVYILECADKTLYTGITTDLARRVREHNGDAPHGAKYTQTRQPVKVVYSKNYRNRSRASVEEARIKKLTRSQKQELIEEHKT